MFPIAKAILHGALARDESRGAHYKPEFEMPGIDASASPDERRRLAGEWCDLFQKRTDRFLKSTIAEFDDKGDPTLSFEAVDTSLIPPRPRLYGLVGADVIEEVWKGASRHFERLRRESGRLLDGGGRAARRIWLGRR
jgi:succinate dehydrogenase / fumarate reductase flavoprotein subunit